MERHLSTGTSVLSSLLALHRTTPRHSVLLSPLAPKKKNASPPSPAFEQTSTQPPTKKPALKRVS